jgi:hypothetical protein
VVVTVRSGGRAVAKALARHGTMSSNGGRLIVCSSGWERETVSAWAARSVSKLHPQLAPMDVAHVTRVEGPGDSAGGQQLTLT